MACTCGVSTRSFPLRSAEGVAVVPLAFVGAGDEATPTGRVGAPFIPFEFTWEELLRDLTAGI